VQSGTGTHANIGCPAAGKTGTTDNFNDAWFVGYTPHLSSSVWVGYPNALTEMRSVHVTVVIDVLRATSTITQALAFRLPQRGMR